jgi:hypothetical protein
MAQFMEQHRDKQKQGGAKTSNQIASELLLKKQ